MNMNMNMNCISELVHTQKKNVVLRKTLKKNGSKREELQRVNLSIITVKMYYFRTVHL